MSKYDIHQLARLGNVVGLERGLGSGASINAKNEYGSTPLHCAIAENQISAVQILLDHGADVTTQDADGKTSLHYAIEHKLPMVLEAMLKQCPAAVSIGDRHGNQPLWTAAFNARGNYEMVSMLLHCGADPNHLNNVNLSPLDIAKRTSDIPLLHLLKK